MVHEAAKTGTKIIGFVGGAVVGPILLTVVTEGLDSLFRHNVTNNDSYGFVLLFTVPGGIWLGAFTGLALAWMGEKDQEVAGVLCVAASVCYLYLPAPFFVILFGFSLKQFGAALLTSSFVFWFLPLWSLGLIVWGIKLQRN